MHILFPRLLFSGTEWWYSTARKDTVCVWSVSRSTVAMSSPTDSSYRILVARATPSGAPTSVKGQRSQRYIIFV